MNNTKGGNACHQNGLAVKHVDDCQERDLDPAKSIFPWSKLSIQTRNRETFTFAEIPVRVSTDYHLTCIYLRAQTALLLKDQS